MSSAGVPGGDAAAAPQRYFCHECNHTVTITPSPSSEPLCPQCHGGFIEEFEIPNPNPNPQPLLLEPFLPGAAFFPNPSSTFNTHNASEFAGLLQSFSPLSAAPTGTHPAGTVGSEPFNGMMLFQNYLQSMMEGGANIQVVLDEGGGRHGTSLGDYFIGPGLEQLIQQLAENDPNRYGTPPASKSVIQALPDIVITTELLASDDSQCAVCKDTFDVGSQAKQMPCQHIYHKDCILPWLEMHNSCPVCRYELPTDDAEYEQQRRAEGTEAAASRPGGPGQSAAAAAVTGEGNSPGPRMVERRLRISLPWLFRGFGVQGEASGAGGSTTADGAPQGGSENPGGQGGSRSETRQEDLD